MASAAARLRGNLAAAISYAEECLILDREGGNEEYISSLLNNIAGLHMTYGDADAARKYIDEALKSNINWTAVPTLQFAMVSLRKST